MTVKKTIRKKTVQIYKLEIWLLDIKPRIWRTFAVPGNIKLPELHEVIQAVMGWENSHLHQFKFGDIYYSDPYPDFDMYDDTLDERKVKLTDLVSKPRQRFIYEYDFGDGWKHMVKVVSVGSAEKGAKYPVCLAGERACPPEDCGGPWGYEDFLEAIRNPDHEEHEEMLEWIGDNFDPEAFDVKMVNRWLKMDR